LKRVAKLTWQCRRGTQELDKLLLRYLQQCYFGASLFEQQQFEHLLNLPDNQLLQLFFNPNQEQTEFAALISKIRQLSSI